NAAGGVVADEIVERRERIGHIIERGTGGRVGGRGRGPSGGAVRDGGGHPAGAGGRGGSARGSHVIGDRARRGVRIVRSVGGGRGAVVGGSVRRGVVDRAGVVGGVVPTAAAIAVHGFADPA